MSIFNINKTKTITAMVIAASGLSVSTANAQFKVEYAAKSDKTASAVPEPRTTHESVVVMKSKVNGHTYEIKIIDGALAFAAVDDEEINPDRVRSADGAITIFDDDGKKLIRFDVPLAPSAPDAPRPIRMDRVWKTADGQRFDFDKGNTFTLQVAPGDIKHTDKTLRLDVIMDSPKVMLGIPLGEPTPALRKHLGLKKDQHVIFVEHPIDGLPAAKAGLEDYDVIVSIEGSDQADGEVLRQAMKDKEPGDTLKLVVLRGGKRINFAVKLAAYDPKALQQATMKVERDLDQSGDVNPFTVHQDTIHGDANQARAQIAQQRVQDLQEKAREAMKDARRQIMEFRDGKLIVRSADNFGHQLDTFRGRLNDQLGEVDPQLIRNHIDELDHRLGVLEERLSRQMDQMNEHMNRLSGMFDRLMDAMDHDSDQDHDQDHDQGDDQGDDD